jgi:ribosomal protein S18 acetylase RimI-like enzyme
LTAAPRPSAPLAASDTVHGARRLAAGYDVFAPAALPGAPAGAAILAAMLTLRTATFDDAQDIVRINVECWQRAYAGIVPDAVLSAMDVRVRTARYRERMAEPGPHETLLATEAGSTVGYVTFGPYRDGRALDETVGEIAALYVDPAAWRTGAGRALTTAAVGRLAERGLDEVRLWVLEANLPARRFYARVGFHPDGATATYPVRHPDGGLVHLAEIRCSNRPG